MRRNVLLVICLLWSVGTVKAQDVQDDVSAMVQEANDQFQAWLSESQKFVADVRFEEKDVVSLIEHWEEFSTLKDEDQELDEGGPVDHKTILEDPEYRSWAKSHGLEAEPWLRKSMRILLFIMREQMEASLEEAEEELPAQLEMIEAQREELGEEMYEQMKQSFEMSTRMFDQQRKGWASLSKPTPAEAKLLEKYSDELLILMNSDGEEEY